MASNHNYSKFGYHITNNRGDQNTNTLFRIIEDGIDSIIVKLKLAVDQKGTSVDGAIGTNPRHIKAVENIIQVFENFKTGQYTALETNFKTSIEDRDKVEIYPNKYGDTYEDIKKKLKENKENAKDGKDEDGNEYTYNIDDKYLNNTNSTDLHVNQDSRVSDDIEDIQNRLNSCVNLEFLYLKKHNEIINIFSFVVDLFDKYKYAIKVILFLLKNLVRQTDTPPPPDTPGTPLTVNLPNPVIKNIDLLLKDQHNIEQIVEGMRNVVNNVDTSIHPVLQDENDNTKYVRDEQAETQIEHNVKSSVASSPSA